MTLPYTAAQATTAHDDWNAMCGHFSLAAATGLPLEDIRTAGVPLKGWMNPTMITQTLRNLHIPHDQHHLKAIQGPAEILHLVDHGAILRIQWEGSWMNPGVPKGAQYQRTHYIACKSGHIMDPLIDPTDLLTVPDWLEIVPTQVIPQIRKATGYHFTHAWTITP